MHRIDLGVTTVHVLPSEQGYLLVDTGYAHDETALLAGLRAVGINLRDISHVLLTHHHDDHAGLVARLTTQRPDLQVILHERARARTRLPDPGPPARPRRQPQQQPHRLLTMNTVHHAAARR